MVTNEEFQNLMLKELMEIKTNMATKRDVEKLETKLTSGIADIIAMNNIVQKEVVALGTKVDKVLVTQTVQGESINILALRQFQTESELAAIREAK